MVYCIDNSNLRHLLHCAEVLSLLIKVGPVGSAQRINRISHVVEIIVCFLVCCDTRLKACTHNSAADLVHWALSSTGNICSTLCGIISMRRKLVRRLVYMAYVPGGGGSYSPFLLIYSVHRTMFVSMTSNLHTSPKPAPRIPPIDHPLRLALSCSDDNSTITYGMVCRFRLNWNTSHRETRRY